ncbi:MULTISPECIES: endolytic transglycosylase MltG [unclassified Kaistella]|uniref:endolytic transglycosylase MltG n=1 Tax=unclassified Kaistella TaxID=2762626 RepID=UPI00273492BD|nr:MULTISPECIES: endolytic transglycosylase MltG [unclassified Kaistella]MDP2453189.1 endolytic transglycosylase MltG [Kaistella sp. SH11-4b]MDP2456246.1 endolytic transglycosylase MltG [Kaistella sp. SH40-3]MDP2459002.1 endolytic transglycosylase MltG [Kaistella sp. SH19-2b]
MKNSKTVIWILFFIISYIGTYIGLKFYQKYYGNNVYKEGYILIPHSANFNSILDSITPYLKNKEQFAEVAKDKNMDKFFSAGRYRIKSGTNNTDLVNMIKAGNQTENTFRIGDFFTVYQMVGKVAKKTELDSLRFATDLDKIATTKGLSNAEDLKKYFFIDSYNFFWTVTPAEFFKKFEDDYNSFWTAERKAKEQSLGLSRDQIYALASLVYKETGGKPDEMKTVAGLYLNRYRKGMKLQSDPTVIYAVSKANNFQGDPIKRVFFKHLREPSPYNTYFSAGIPPGPICMVDKNSVDAVLNAQKNDFIYMCADPARFGFHKFTASAAEHAVNAKAYQDWLNSKNIK